MKKAENLDDLAENRKKASASKASASKASASKASASKASASKASASKASASKASASKASASKASASKASASKASASKASASKASASKASASKASSSKASASKASLLGDQKDQSAAKSGESSEETKTETSSPSSDESELLEPDKHEIGDAINKALHRCRDIEAATRLMVPISAILQRNMIESARSALNVIHENGQSDSEDPEIDEVTAAKLDEAFLALDRLGEANLPETLLSSLFLGLFSTYDAFTGNLLQAIYHKRPELVDELNVEIPLSELLRYNSFEELKESLLLDEIEKIRRKSYVDQFEYLEKRFGLKLKSFSNWPKFVELGQRRNLITHCEGVTSKQYIKICTENSVTHDETPSEGKRLDIHPKYLLEACSVIYEVALKLGQTLWRKIFPDEYDQANEHLTGAIYESLRIERWDRAILMSEFATSVQKQVRDMDRRIRVINMAIALRFSEKDKACDEILSSEDWSAAALDFKLAVEVLNRRFDKAASIMLKIGQKGELINQRSYHVFPLFREFRRSQSFLEAYENVYNSSYASAAAETASKAEDKEISSPPSKLSEEIMGLSKLRPSLETIKFLIG